MCAGGDNLYRNTPIAYRPIGRTGDKGPPPHIKIRPTRPRLFTTTKHTMKVLVVLCVFLAAAYGAQRQKDYSGYKLIEVTPTSEDHVKELHQLEDVKGVDVWSAVRSNTATTLLLAPNVFKKIAKQLEQSGMSVSVKNNNMQKALDEEKMDNDAHRVRTRASRTVVGTFARYDDIQDWLATRVSQNSRIASLEDIGPTYEGRSMKVLKIGKPASRFTSKPSIWLNSGIHAREWLTVATMIYMIERLLNDYSTNSVVRNLVDSYDWYLLPVANPDGYEYTHTGDRMWRKTRSPTYYSWCRGADPNRNFNYMFGVSGVSSNPCASTYPGARAFSEKCADNIAKFVSRKSSSMKLFMDIHAYSQLWLTPWAWGSPKPSDYSEMERVANIGANAIRGVNGRRFQVGTPPDILYAASGGSYDWAKGVAGVKYAYALELYPTNSGGNGFVVPTSEIPNSGKEIWAAVQAVVAAMK